MDASTENDLRLMKEELRKQRWLLIPQGVLFLLFYALSFFIRSLLSFRCIALVNGSYFCLNAVFTLWQERVPDLQCIRQRGHSRELFHLLYCVIAYISFTLSQDQYNEHLLEMGSLFLLPASMAWECRDASNMSTLTVFLLLHSSMTIVRFSGEFGMSGWQKILVACTADIIIWNIAGGRSAVRSAKEQVASLCHTIERLLSTMCDGFCVLDCEGIVLGADSKMLSLLSLGSTSSLDGRHWGHLMAGETPAAFEKSEGLRSVQLLTGDGSLVTAEVYTVGCTLAPASIRAILGRCCTDEGKDVNGFVCAVRQLGTLDSNENIPGNQLKVRAMSSLIAAEDCTVSGADTAPGLPDSTQPDESATAALELEDSMQADQFEPSALELEASEADLISEPPSLRSGMHGGSFFPPIKALGIGVGEYTKVELAGRGGQGTVWRVQGVSGDCFAMKELPLPGILWRRDFTKNLVRADREVRCLKRLRWASSVIVPIIDSWLREDMTLCIVMEWCPFTLKSLLTSRRHSNQGPPPPEDTCRWLVQVVAGIAAIHGEGFMHRDIKPSNLLLTADMHCCKIADMGLSREVRQAALEAEIEVGSTISDTASAFSGYTAKCGTRGFQSPEVRQGGIYDSAADIYSLGCVVLQLLVSDESDVLPPTAETATPLLAKSLMVAGVAGTASVLPELHELCLQMLQEVPTKRPTALALAQSVVLKSDLGALLCEHPELERVLGAASLSQERENVSKAVLGCAQVDARGIVREWSAGLTEALALTRERALGRRFLDNFVAPEDRSEVSRLIGPVVRRLVHQACGQITLQGTACKLRLWAIVQCSEPQSGARRLLSPDLTFEFWREQPPAAGIRDSEARLDPGLKVSSSPPKSQGYHRFAFSTGLAVQSLPAQLVNIRSASPQSASDMDVREGLRERHTWTSPKPAN